MLSLFSSAALDSSRALPRRPRAQAEDDCGPRGQQLHAVTSGGIRWVKFMWCYGYLVAPFSLDGCYTHCSFNLLSARQIVHLLFFFLNTQVEAL